VEGLAVLLHEKYAGMKWPQLKELVDLSSGALKNHLDSLMEVGLAGKTKSNYRISRSGLNVLTQVDEVIEAIKKILEAKKVEAQ
jgi:predicted transcriptional regulator